MGAIESGLERKFCALGEDVKVTDGSVIEGYASLFGIGDHGGDTVERGAYVRSLEALAARGGRVKMLWQHDPAQPIGVWDEVAEDARGLRVKGRILTDVERGREAIALIGAGAIDGLSIGYRTKRARKGDDGGRILTELDLWEVSLVTFPMLSEARLGGKGAARRGSEHAMREMTAAIGAARRALGRA